MVFADHRAVPFFKKHGFSDDPMLNARYAEVLEPWARSMARVRVRVTVRV